MFASNLGGVVWSDCCVLFSFFLLKLVTYICPLHNDPSAWNFSELEISFVKKVSKVRKDQDGDPRHLGLPVSRASVKAP